MKNQRKRQSKQRRRRGIE